MTARKRLTSSRMTDCPFELTLTRTAIGWQVEVQEPTHNHEAFAYAAALPRYRGRGRARGGSSQTTSRGGSSQISPRIALQITAQSNQLTQERVGGENGVEVKILPQMT